VGSPPHGNRTYIRVMFQIADPYSQMLFEKKAETASHGQAWGCSFSKI
jgi:hypothetical protein